MLVIKRKKGEAIKIGDDIELTIVSIDDKTVKLAIDAPREITILRKELIQEVSEENKNAVKFDINALNEINKQILITQNTQKKAEDTEK